MVYDSGANTGDPPVDDGRIYSYSYIDKDINTKSFRLTSTGKSVKCKYCKTYYKPNNYYKCPNCGASEQ